MNTFFLLVVIAQPTMYVALDDEVKSKHLYAEMTRDWTKSPFMTKETLPVAKGINADIVELKSLVKIEFVKPHFLKHYPSFRFSKYEKWEAFDRRAFCSSSWAYKTLMYHAYTFYKPHYDHVFREKFHKETDEFYKKREKETVEFLTKNKGYTRWQPKEHWAGTGDIYNYHTRKFEEIDFPRRPKELTPKGYKKWRAAKAKAVFEFCQKNAEDYRTNMPREHYPGWGDVYNIKTRKYENINFKVKQPVLMELRVDPLPYGSAERINDDLD